MGFTIPKGWKVSKHIQASLRYNTMVMYRRGINLSQSIFSTHKNPKYFPDPEKIDPSRFEGKGPASYTFVPFGGGTQMCLRMEYARLEIFTFMHNVVTKFKLEKANPNEKIVFNP